MLRSLTMIALVVVISTGVAFYQTVAKGQDADGKAAIEDTVQSLFNAIQAKNLDAALGFWEEDSPRYAGFGRFVGGLLAGNADYRFTDFAYSHWEVGEEQAIVRVRFQRVSRGAGGTAPSQHLTVWNLQLVKRQGRWPLWDQSDAIADFAYYLLKETRTKDERTQLFQNSTDLISAELTQGLNELADAEARKANYEEAQRISVVALESASLFGDKRYLAQTYEVRGLIFDKQGAHEGMLENSLLASDLYHVARDARGEARVLNNIGRGARPCGPKFEVGNGGLIRMRDGAGATDQRRRHTGDNVVSVRGGSAEQRRFAMERPRRQYQRPDGEVLRIPIARGRPQGGFDHQGRGVATGAALTLALASVFSCVLLGSVCPCR